MTSLQTTISKNLSPPIYLNNQREILSSNISNYVIYYHLVIAFLFHSFVTAFFLLWQLAVDTIKKDLLASKFAHCIFPLLALHWWFLSHYPLYQLQHGILDHRQKSSFFSTGGGMTPGSLPSNDQWTIAKKRQESLIFKNMVKILLLFLILALIDILYLSIQLLPIAFQCISHWNTGEKIPLECGGRDEKDHEDSNYSRSNPYGLYLLTLVMTVVHIMSSFWIIYIAWSSRNYKLYSAVASTD